MNSCLAFLLLKSCVNRKYKVNHSKSIDPSINIVSKIIILYVRNIFETLHILKLFFIGLYKYCPIQ